jgi:hypothetical protein
VNDTLASKSPNAVQRNWKVSSEFPCCPNELKEEPIFTYADNLKVGQVFSRNEYYTSIVSKYRISDDGKSLYVITESKNTKEAALAKITFENGLFIHESLGSFFDPKGAEKQFCLALGLEWSGGDSIDDYC